MQHKNINFIADTIDNGIFVIDNQLIVKSWNLWLEDHTKIKANDIISKSILDFFPNFKQNSFSRKIKTTLRLNTPSFYNTSKEGYLLKIKLNYITSTIHEFMQQNISILPYNTSKNEVMVYIYDNTQLSNLHNQIKLSKFEILEKNIELNIQNNQFEQLLDSTIEGIIISDDENICVSANKNIRKLLGYEEDDDLRGLNILDFVSKKHKDTVRKNLNILDTEPYEIELIKKDASLFPVLVREKTIKNSVPYRRISAIVDLTELRQKDNYIYEQAKLSSMAEMIGNIAHQWRQPLTVITAAASGLILKKSFNQLTDEAIIKSCNNINENAQYLSRTIDEFKNFIKGDRVKTDFNLSEIIDSFIALNDSMIIDYNINIKLDLDDDIEIYGYMQELKQCFINIFNNSKDILKYCTCKYKYILISTKKEDENIIISIKDSGGGIDDEVIPKIFEPYFTTKHQSIGTGLGLYVVHKVITKDMKGTIVASNSIFKIDDIKYTGALFTIKIPNSTKYER
ncbi:MAG TPA: PAS domain-containing sensor histidine kinase [Arcobacter sp.]|nr:PAS domain-containing sensor histidine kinase [Arcobacter sp.]